MQSSPHRGLGTLLLAGFLGYPRMVVSYWVSYLYRVRTHTVCVLACHANAHYEIISNTQGEQCSNRPQVNRYIETRLLTGATGYDGSASAPVDHPMSGHSPSGAAAPGHSVHVIDNSRSLDGWSVMDSHSE